MKRSKDALLGQLGQTQAAAAETQRALERTSADLAEQRGRADKAARDLAQREAALKQEGRLLAAAQQAHRGTHLVAESDSRSLRAEKVRRLAAEQRVGQLTHELEVAAHQRLLAADYDLEERLMGRRDEALAAELRDVRVHRDEAIAEREHLLVEQARAAAMAYRWQYVNHPHRWQKDRRPKWVVVGFLVDEETEQYLLKHSVRRIARKKKDTQQLMAEVGT